MEALAMQPEDGEPEVGEPDGANRRREHRHRVFKSGEIVFNRGYSVFECTIRNLSKGGALLEIPSSLGIPTRFLLTMASGPRNQPCEVRWRTDRHMGVAFAPASAA